VDRDGAIAARSWPFRRVQSVEHGQRARLSALPILQRLGGRSEPLGPGVRPPRCALTPAGSVRPRRWSLLEQFIVPRC